MHKYLTHIKNITKTGAIGPIGDVAKDLLVQKVLENYSPEQPYRIVELGPGTGVITEVLAGYAQVRLDCFEILPEFARHLEQQFADYPDVHIYNVSAEHISDYLEENSIDVVLTTIPMSFLEDTIDTIMQGVQHILKPGGTLVSGQVRSKQNIIYERYVGPLSFSQRIWGLQPVMVTCYDYVAEGL